MFKIKDKGHSIAYQQQKRYKTATDRLSDIKLSKGVGIKVDGTGKASDGLKLQCTAIATISSLIIVHCAARANQISVYRVVDGSGSWIKRRVAYPIMMTTMTAWVVHTYRVGQKSGPFLKVHNSCI